MSKKNMDIRSFLTFGKKPDTQSAVSPKKRPIVISSDEDTPKKRKIATSKTDDKPSEKLSFGISYNKHMSKNKSEVSEENIKDRKTESKSSNKAGTLSKKNKESTHQIPPSVTLSSDEDEEIMAKSSASQAKRQTAVILSDSDEEDTYNKKHAHTKEQISTLKKDKLVPKNAIDFFGNERVKQKSSVKKSTLPSIKSDDKFEATLKQLDENKTKKEKDFENTLLDLEDDFDADIISETINNAVINESKSKKYTPKKTSKAIESSNTHQSLNDSGMDPDQAKYERKRQSVAMYHQYLNRAGPVNRGNKVLPEGKADCLKNLCFLKTGVLDSMDREEFEDLVKRHGGRTVSAVSKKVNYLVVGVEAGPAKLNKAIEYGIKSLSEDELLDMVLTRSGLKPKYVKAANDGNGDVIEYIQESNLSTPHDKGKSDRMPQQTAQKQYEEKPKDKSKSPKRGKSDIDVSVEWEPKTKKNKRNDDIPEFTKLPSKKEQSSKLKLKGTSLALTENPSTSISIIKSVPIPRIFIETAEVDKSSISLADKHKPTESTKIIGQRKNVELLTNWLKNWAKNHLGKNKPKLQKPSLFCQNNDGAYFKCALLSGPPGVGKTTTAHVIAKELGFDVVEYNASDTRSKKMLQLEIQRQLQSKSIASFAKDGTAPTSRHVVLMDEVDGMSGNEDRGGLQELIALIKKTDVPIICMCNDRNHQKMRTFITHVFELQFGKPSMQQIKGAALSICFREGIKIDGDTLEQMITTAGNDVRQVLNHLTMWSTIQNSTEDTITTIDDKSSTEYKFNHKDVTFGPWQVTRKQLDYNEYKTLSLAERGRLFYYDYSIGPLFMQENYLNATPHEYEKPKSKRELAKNHVRRIAEASSAISVGDVIERKIRSTNNWSLLDAQGLFATVIPSYYVHGNLKCINFPAWLGKNSRATKFKRMLSELRNHTRMSLPGNKQALNLDYLKPLRNRIVSSLTKEDVSGAIQIMHTNNLLKVDFDNILELTGWPQVYNDFGNIAVKTKSAFTRNYNKSSHMLPYSIETVVKRKKHTAINDVDYGDESASDEEQNNDDADDIKNSAMIKMKTKKETEKGKDSNSKKNPSKPKSSTNKR